jgi:hypothetical protein
MPCPYSLDGRDYGKMLFCFRNGIIPTWCSTGSRFFTYRFVYIIGSSFQDDAEKIRQGAGD